MHCKLPSQRSEPELTMLTSSSRSLHDNAVRVKPKVQNVKPSTFWVAILKAEKAPTGNNTEEDFLWIKSPGVSLP